MTTTQLHGLPSSSSAALRGANLAFQNSNKLRGPAAVAPSHETTHDGALAAATISAQTTGSSVTGLPDMDHPQTRQMISSRLQQHGPQYLSPKGGVGGGGKDASFIAATLAASRSASPSPKARRSPSVNTIGSYFGSPAAAGDHVDAASIPPTGKLIRMFEGGSPRRRQRGSVDEGVLRQRRLTPSPKRMQRLPTHLSEESLERDVEEEEKTPSKPPRPPVRPRTPPPKPAIIQQTSTPEKTAASQRPKKPTPVPQAQSPPPKPLVERQPRTQPRPAIEARIKPNATAADMDERPSKPLKPVSAAAKSRPEPVSQNMTESRSPVVRQSTPVVQSPTSLRMNKPPLPPPASMPPQHSRTTSHPLPQLQSPGDPEKRDSPRPKKSQPQPPTPPKPRGIARVDRADSLKHGLSRIKTTELNPARTSETDSPQDVFVSAPTTPTYSSPPPRRLSLKSPSLTQEHVGRQSPSPTRWSGRPSHAPSRNNLDLNSLTSAIMAGSLASARLTPSNTGSTVPPILPQRTRSPRLRTTMRSTAGPGSDSEDDRHKKSRRPRLRTGKHAHHEGARKKWREQIRPRERKRYEAVWASNRGHHLPTQPASRTSSSGSTSNGGSSSNIHCDYGDHIANVVVRDIWRRSRLPEDELGEVWELVDRKKRGILDRAEFVVGMWLIDQRLRGRKIPHKVTDSVWASAHGMLRVKAPKRH